MLRKVSRGWGVGGTRENLVLHTVHNAHTYVHTYLRTYINIDYTVVTLLLIDATARSSLAAAHCVQYWGELASRLTCCILVNNRTI